MPNIFDGLEKTDIDSLRYQIASLEEITVKNVMGEMGQKAHRGAVKVFNGLRKLVNSQPVGEPKVVSMEERVDTKYKELKTLDKDALLNRMQTVLTEKVNSAGNESILEDNKEELSAYVITLAAKCFNKGVDKQFENVNYFWLKDDEDGLLAGKAFVKDSVEKAAPIAVEEASWGLPVRCVKE